MKQKAFHFEIKDMIYQFIAAFDDVVIQKYDNARNSVGQIKVPYVLQAKNRVIHYIVNKEKNLNLPVISVSVQGIRYNSGREKNKQQDFYERHNDNGGNGFFKHAVPVDITIGMSIMSKYQQDMDQILSNFMTSANPYIVLIWKLPKTLGFSEDYIIEIPVSWDGNVNIVQPVELQEDQKQLITADATFTIEGWLFKEGINSQDNRIYTIDQDFEIPSAIEIITDKTPLEEINQLINPQESEEVLILSSLSS